jgi:hypothetical protein
MGGSHHNDHHDDHEHHDHPVSNNFFYNIQTSGTSVLRVYLTIE